MGLETSSTSAKFLISATYSELQQLVNNNALKVGATYLLSDFCTKYNQPVTNDLKTEATEPLLLTAIDVNKFHNECKSTVYCFDVVYYNFNDNLCEDGETERNGRITGRWDLENNNKLIGNDWRTVKYKRYTIDTAASNILAYDDDTNYIVGDLITASSNIYACVQNCIGETPESNEAYWLLLFENYATLPICLDKTGDLTKVYIKDVQKSLVGGGAGTDYLFFNGTGEFKNNNLSLYNPVYSNFYNNTILINSTLKSNELFTSSYFYNCTFINSEFNNNTFMASEFNNNIIFNSYIYLNSFNFTGIYYNYLSNSFINNNNTNSSNINYVVLINSSFYFDCFLNSVFKENIFLNSNLVNIESTNSNINSLYFITKIFNNNKLISISEIDYSLATHVFADYYCELAKNSGDIAYLRYCDADNVYQIVLPTE